MVIEPKEITTTLRYKANTNRNGYRQVDRCLLRMGELYNAAIRHRQSATGSHQRGWSLKLQNAHLTDLHRNHPDFNPYSRRLLEATLKRANLAYTRYFIQPDAGRPRTKNPHLFNTIEISEPAANHLKISEDSRTASVHIKGLPTLTLKADHRLPKDKQPRAIRITRTPRRLNVSLVFNIEARTPTKPLHLSVGIDPGVKHLLTAVDDEGEVLQVLGLDDSLHRKTKRRLLRKIQRQRDTALKEGRAHFVSHRNRNGTLKRRFRWTHRPSKSYLNALAQLRRVEQKRQDAREGLQHRITSHLVRDHNLIAIEDTRIRNMTRTAKGTMEQPGSKVRQKAGLNRAILFQGWYGIRSKLEYKCLWQGRTFVPVPAMNTSRTCNQCGSVNPANRRSQTRFQCQDCGYTQNADVNAAENIRRLGLSAWARAENQPGHAAGDPPVADTSATGLSHGTVHALHARTRLLTE